MAIGNITALSLAHPPGRALCVAVGFLLLAPWAAEAQVYRATDIGTLGGAHTYGYAINNSRQIVGTSEDAQGTPRAFIYSNGTMRDLGTLGGASAEARDINSAGQIVGTSDTAGSKAAHATLWDHGAIRDLGTLAGDPALNSHAEAIDEQGVIVGGADILCLPAEGGVPCGALGRAEHAFAYVGGTLTDIDRGTQGVGSYASAIDDSGKISGFIENTITYVADQPAYWPSRASGLIPLGVVPARLPRLTHTDLNRLIDKATPVAPYFLRYATALNDAGMIVAVGVDAASGAVHTFLLSPVAVSLTPTPTQLKFGNVLDTTSVTKDVVVNNTAATPVDFQISTTGPFSVKSGCGASVPPASTCTISVTFSPVLPGPLSGTLTLTSAAGTGGSTVLLAIQLSGTGTFVAKLSYDTHEVWDWTILDFVTMYALSWSSAPGVSCKATEGLLWGDGWSGNLGSSGRKDMDLVAAGASGDVTYGIDCKGGGLESKAEVTVYVDTTGSGGGGGSMGIGQLLILLASALYSSWTRVRQVHTSILA